MAQKAFVNNEGGRELLDEELQLLYGGSSGSNNWFSGLSLPQNSEKTSIVTGKDHIAAPKFDYAQSFQALQSLTSGLIQTLL